MKKKLLVISTDDALLATLWRHFEPESSELIVANSGWAGLQLAKAEHPDIIICTADLPGLNGYEFLRTVRTDTNIAHTPFILVSDQPDMESRCRAIALGADDYLTQPIPLNQLLLAIQIQLNSSDSTPHKKLTLQ